MSIRDTHIYHMINAMQQHDCRTARDVQQHIPYFLDVSYICQLASYQRQNRDRFGGVINHIKRGSPLGNEASRWCFQPDTGPYSTEDQRYNMIAGGTSTIRTFCTQADNLQAIYTKAAEHAILNGHPQLAISYTQLSGAIGLVRVSSVDVNHQQELLKASGDLP